LLVDVVLVLDRKLRPRSTASALPYDLTICSRITLTGDGDNAFVNRKIETLSSHHVQKILKADRQINDN
jgi:hypothetical protein